MNIEEVINEEKHFLPDQAPLEFFVHHNTLHHLEAMPFEEAVEFMAKKYDKNAYMDLDFYRQAFAEGRVRKDLIDKEMDHFLKGRNELKDFFQYLLFEADFSNDLGQRRYSFVHMESFEKDKFQSLLKLVSPTEKTNSFFREKNTSDFPKSDELIISFLSAYMDQGVSYWRFPEEGYEDVLVCFKEFLDGAGLEMSVLKDLDIYTNAYKADRLNSFDQLASPYTAERIKNVLHRLPGWAGMVNKLERQPEFATRRKPQINLFDFVFMALFLEKHFPINTGEDELLSKEDLQFFMAHEFYEYQKKQGSEQKAELLIHFFSEVSLWDLERVFHLAMERTYMDKVLSGLALNPKNSSVDKLKFQAFFCLDDREESFRRHLEETSKEVGTFGVAGFFGLDMLFQSHKAVRPRQLCPPAVSPSIVIREAARDDRKKNKLLPVHNYYGERTLFRSTFMTFLKGPLNLIKISKKIFYGDSPQEEVERTDLLLTYTAEEMGNRVASILKGSGLVKNFAPLVAIIGHGSNSMNNPHLAAYRCGACAGGNGSPNARGFCMMANNEEVRSLLKEVHNLSIPESTYFIGGFHDTCSDNVIFSDIDLLPPDHKKLFEEFKSICSRASEKNANERFRRLKLVPLDISPKESKKHAEHRANHPGEARPELGHAGNALTFVGRRNSTKNIFLDRRVFLTSYDPDIDEDGKILEALLRAVVPVCIGINLEYYFSKVDNEKYGCGTKTPHNVTSLLGVVNGSIGDLRTGLVWQMVELHEPLRNLFIIESKKETIHKIFKDNPAIERVILNRWTYVALKDPDSNEYSFFEDGEFHPYKPVKMDILRGLSSGEIYQGKRGYIDFAIIEE